MKLFKTVSLLLSVLFCLSLCACGQKTEPAEREGCVTLVNDAVDYVFSYPEEWEIDRNDGMVAIKYNVGERGAIAYASISVEAFALQDASTVANTYWDTNRKDLEELYGERIVFTSEKEDMRLGGVVANRNRYTLRLTDVTYAFEQVVCIRNGYVYLLTLTVPEVKKNEVTKCFETVLESFSFTR